MKMPKMTLEEALQKAQEAVDNGYLMPYPQACIVLAEEVKRLKQRRKRVKKPVEPSKELSEALDKLLPDTGASKCTYCDTTENSYKDGWYGYKYF